MGDSANMTTANGAKMSEFTQSWLWRPNLIVFISSACTMVVELVAGRVIAPYVGVSLYTWTGVIGVVLGGISLGNYSGGRLADRWASARLLGAILFLGGVSCLSILLAQQLDRLMPDSLPIVLRILALSATLFLIPSAVLGAVSPVVAKLAIRNLAETGSTVGKIYASSSMGAIVGTFATGFILIAWFGTRTIVWGVSVVLLALGLTFFLYSRRKLLVAATLLVLAVSVVALRSGWLRSICTEETNYFCIKVQEQDRDGKPVRVLILDRLVHSYSSLDDPTTLVYIYERMYAEATAYLAERSSQLRALFIGGGGYTFPRYMEALYPDSELHVIEIDPGVTQVAYDLLGLRRDTSIVTYNQDARRFFDRDPDRAYDLILGDAFNDFSVPYHLTTKEFNDQVRGWLAEGGMYVVNIIDGPSGDFLRAYVHTLRDTFPYVYVAPTLVAWRQAPRSTFVIIATDTPLDLAVLASASISTGSSYLKEQLMTQQELDGLLTKGRLIKLTDEYAPVDQMLAPVFREQTLDAE
jgi:spermidine synthase